MRADVFQRHLARRLVYRPEPRVVHRTTYPEHDDSLVYVELSDGSAYWLAFCRADECPEDPEFWASTRARALGEKVREMARGIKRGLGGRIRGVLERMAPFLWPDYPRPGKVYRENTRNLRRRADNDLSDHQVGEIG